MATVKARVSRRMFPLASMVLGWFEAADHPYLIAVNNKLSDMYIDHIVDETVTRGAKGIPSIFE